MSDAACDFIVIGGGIAGASIAYWLASRGRVVILEREDQPGYHSTGRSAAMFMESYGTPQVRSLTRASRRFFERPPSGFATEPLLAPRSVLSLAAAAAPEQLERLWESLSPLSAHVQRLDPAAACALLPVLRREEISGAVLESDPCDIDVHILHQGFLRAVRRHGSEIVCGAAVTHIEFAAPEWTVHAGEARFRAPVLINAAGAWADPVATLAGVAPLGVEPRRRSAFLFAPPAKLDISRWPMVLGAADDWYIKPVGGMLLGSPANADPTHPQDVQPEELDIAIGVERIERLTTLTIERPSRAWAGLRSFVADGDLVGGFDDSISGFFWLAAQGGYGIQTSPAMGEACAALACGEPIPSHIADFGINAAMLSPNRLRRL